MKQFYVKDVQKFLVQVFYWILQCNQNMLLYLTVNLQINVFLYNTSVLNNQNYDLVRYDVTIDLWYHCLQSQVYTPLFITTSTDQYFVVCVRHNPPSLSPWQDVIGSTSASNHSMLYPALNWFKPIKKIPGFLTINYNWI